MRLTALMAHATHVQKHAGIDRSATKVPRTKQQGISRAMQSRTPAQQRADATGSKARSQNRYVGVGLGR